MIPVRINPEIKETGIQLEKTIKYRITQGFFINLEQMEYKTITLLKFTLKQVLIPFGKNRILKLAAQ
jgi:thiamine pyrophosphokinase